MTRLYPHPDNHLPGIPQAPLDVTDDEARRLLSYTPPAFFATEQPYTRHYDEMEPVDLTGQVEGILLANLRARIGDPDAELPPLPDPPPAKGAKKNPDPAPAGSLDSKE